MPFFYLALCICTAFPACVRVILNRNRTLVTLQSLFLARTRNSAQHRWAQQNASNNLSDDLWLVNVAEKLAQDACECKGKCYLQCTCTHTRVETLRHVGETAQDHGTAMQARRFSAGSCPDLHDEQQQGILLNDSEELGPYCVGGCRASVRQQVAGRPG